MKEKTTINNSPTVYLGLGGNVGDVVTRFRQAIDRIEGHPEVSGVVRASVWRTAPVGQVTDQPAFLNTGVRLQMAMRDPVALLRSLQAIEADLGRQRDVVGGPRTLDIDVLLWGELACTLVGPPAITLPHPRICQRAFALAPLVELGGRDLHIPGSQLRAGELLEMALGDPAQAIERTSISL